MLHFCTPEFGLRGTTLEMIASIHTDLPYDITVGNDGHPKEKGFPPDIDGARLIDFPDNQGYSKNCNRTIAAIGCNPDDILFLLNNDMTFLPGTIEMLYDYASTHRALVAPTVIVPDHVKLTHRQFQHIPLDPKREMAPFHPTMLAGCCVAMRYSLWAELGGYDEEFNFYYSDDDLCIRAARLGIENTVLPNCLIQHEFSKTILLKHKEFGEDARKDYAAFRRKYPEIHWEMTGDYK